MPVALLSATLRNAPAVGVQATVFGIECEVKEKTDPANIVFELVGAEDKINLVATKTNSKVTKLV